MRPSQAGAGEKALCAYVVLLANVAEEEMDPEVNNLLYCCVNCLSSNCVINKRRRSTMMKKKEALV